MKKSFGILAVACLGLVLAATPRGQERRGGRPNHDSEEQQNVRGGKGDDLEPNGKGWGEAPRARSQQKKVTTNGINYHNGPVILGTTNVYYIWYGNWAGNTAVPILNDFANSLGGSPYFNINTSYYDGANRHVTNAVAFNPLVYTDNYSRGTAISDGDVQTIVSTAITGGALGPADPNGVYFVLTSADVNETSGFCTQYCGWHTHGTIGTNDIKYSFIGNAARCPNACAVQTTSPNGNAGADAMASIIAHELDESVTDPDLNAWFDSRGSENADKCAWTFGSLYKAPNGAYANMKLGSRDFLLQQNWVNASGGYCAKGL